MLVNLIYIIVGIALVIWGADRLTDGAASLARGMRVPEIIIGLTIVAAGTSAPELFVSLVSAIKGTSDLAVGNVIGSNIYNTMLIVGCSALVAPMAVSPSTVKKDIPFSVLASLLLFMLCFDDMDSPHLWGNELTRSDGLIMLAGFAAFMIYTFNAAKKDGLMPTEEELEENSELPKDYSKLWRNISFMVLGLACLIIGSNLFVDAASYVAYRYGVRQSVVGLTIVAGGTSCRSDDDARERRAVVALRLYQVFCIAERRSRAALRIRPLYVLALLSAIAINTGVLAQPPLTKQENETERKSENQCAVYALQHSVLRLPDYGKRT